jgi:hypothetical protein
MRWISGRAHSACWMAMCVLGLACGGDATAASRGGEHPDSPTASGPLDNPALAASGCGLPNLTQPCTCNGAPGRQVCDGKRFGACECAAMGGNGQSSSTLGLEGNARSDIHFVWDKTKADADSGGCLPGDYEGNFGGIYWSYIATLAPISDLAVPVANIDLPDAPSGFHFTVEPAQGGETVLHIKGVMDGTADLTFPFKAQIEGELDCKTKSFNARMYDGSYSVLIDGLVAQDFQGTMWGSYDVRTHTFVEGEWDVAETSGMPPGKAAPMLPRDFSRDGFGGYGTWAAALPTDVSDPKITACPSDFECDPGPLGPNKLLCSSLLGPPGCDTDADCDGEFPAGGVECLKTTAFSTCLKECKP